MTLFHCADAARVEFRITDEVSHAGNNLNLPDYFRRLKCECRSGNQWVHFIQRF